ncbi:MAG: hypothetical protein CSA22_03255 [Deltaproteobacteria bacterium]|nr:MAG: hypothetical protein CSA22_03255 [Deltaproteobacteria bacterium]
MTPETQSPLPLLVPYTLPGSRLLSLAEVLFGGCAVIRPIAGSLSHTADQARVSGRLSLFTLPDMDPAKLSARLQAMEEWASMQGAMDAQRLRHKPAAPADDTQVSHHEIRKWIQAKETATPARSDPLWDAALLLMLAEKSDLETDAITRSLDALDHRAADFFTSLSDPDTPPDLPELPDTYRRGPAQTDPAGGHAADRVIAWKQVFSALEGRLPGSLVLLTDSPAVWECLIGDPSAQAPVCASVQPDHTDHADVFRAWVNDPSIKRPVFPAPVENHAVYTVKRQAVPLKARENTLLYLIQPEA